jgi:hypothetical protein
VEGVPVDAISAARAAGRISAEEQALLEEAIAAREVSRESSTPAGTSDRATPATATGGGTAVTSSTTLPWYGGHLVMGRPR